MACRRGREGGVLKVEEGMEVLERPVRRPRKQCGDGECSRTLIRDVGSWGRGGIDPSKIEANKGVR